MPLFKFRQNVLLHILVPRNLADFSLRSCRTCCMYKYLRLIVLTSETINLLEVITYHGCIITNRKLKIAFKNSNFLIIFSYLHFNQSVAVRRSVLMLFEKKKIIKVSETIFEQLYLTIRFSVYQPVVLVKLSLLLKFSKSPSNCNIGVK